jgi:NAD(P)-dependent dehydrogenase (short-subunit alcohol dehydrogenase family)
MTGTATTQRFSGKVVLVTGAASGIGRASALAFAREGATVVVADQNAQGGDETVRTIREAGATASFIAVDVSKNADVQSLVEKTLSLHGRLDCAHNNAGIPGTRARTADRTEDDWDRTMNVNAKGVWLCMKHEIPLMLKQGKGAIVNTASVAGLLGLRRFSAYSASKHAVLGLTKSAALEYFRHGIRINAVCPGLIDTELVQTAVLGAHSRIPGALRRGMEAAVRGYMGRHQVAGRMGQAAEVAEAVLWLCSDAASYVSGHTLTVDGGASVK